MVGLVGGRGLGLVGGWLVFEGGWHFSDRDEVEGHGEECTNNRAEDPDPEVVRLAGDRGRAEGSGGVEGARGEGRENSEQETECRTDGNGSDVAGLGAGVADRLEDDVHGDERSDDLGCTQPRPVSFARG